MCLQYLVLLVLLCTLKVLYFLYQHISVHDSLVLLLILTLSSLSLVLMLSSYICSFIVGQIKILAVARGAKLSDFWIPTRGAGVLPTPCAGGAGVPAAPWLSWTNPCLLKRVIRYVVLSSGCGTTSCGCVSFCVILWSTGSPSAVMACRICSCCIILRGSYSLPSSSSLLARRA